MVALETSRAEPCSRQSCQASPYVLPGAGAKTPGRSLTADRQTLAAFRTPALEDETPVFRAHAHQESVRPFAVARIGLERALSLHAQYFPSIWKRTDNVSERVWKVSIRQGNAEVSKEIGLC